MALKLGKCRLCLKLGDFYSIFTVDNSLQLAEMAMHCARIKIYDGDGLPDKICSECIQKLSSAHIFKQQCERADQELRRNYVPPPGFSVTPSPNRQSSDSAFSSHTDLSKPSNESKITPPNRSRKRSRESDNASNASLSRDNSVKPSSSNQHVKEKRSIEKRPRLASETSARESDYEDHSLSRFSPEPESDSDAPLLKNEYTCNMCDKSYETKRSLLVHKQWHTRKPSLFSPKLGENAVVDIPKNSVNNTTDDEDKVSCDKCGRMFKLKIMLKRHYETCTGGDIKESPTKQSPKKELLVSLEPIKIGCEICSTQFKNLENLEKHMRVCHAAVLNNKKRESLVLRIGKADAKKTAVPCIYCAQPFEDYYVHVAHFNTCPQRRDLPYYECPVCKRTCGKKNNYFTHIKNIHLEPRCVQTIGGGGGGGTESGDGGGGGGSAEYFECRMCCKRLASQELLIKHLAAHVSHIDDAGSVGDDDSRASTADDAASVHSEYGSGSGPLKCHYCDKTFTYKKALSTHELKHTTGELEVKREPPDPPPAAPSTLATPPPSSLAAPSPSLARTPAQAQLYRDTDSEDSSQDGDLTCDICEKMFSYKRLLIQHKKTKHNMSSGHKRANIQLKDCKVTCLICDLDMTVGTFKEHNQIHIAANMKPRNKYTCIDCGDTFKNLQTLGTHIKLVHRLKKQVSKKVVVPDLADFCEVVVTKSEPLDEPVQSYNDNGYGAVPTESSKPVVNLSGFTCPVCSKKMDTLVSLKRHVNWHTNVGNNIEKKIECFICKEVFRFKGHFRLHMRGHYSDPALDPKFLQCSQCGRRSKNLRAAQAHMNFHRQTRFQGKDYRCSLCKRLFQDRKVYLSHMAIHYKRGDSILSTPGVDQAAAAAAGLASITCPYCGKVCDSEVSLKHHIIWHKSKTSLFGARHECPTCHLQFTNKKMQELHVRTHYEDENGPYKCNICGKGYNDEDFFRRHVKGHNFDHQSHKKRIAKLRENKVKCPICERYYSDLPKLIRHLRRSHPQSKMIKEDPDAPAQKVYSCKLCAKVFRDPKRFQMHEEAHLRKPEFFKCKFCGKKTISLKNHNIHIKSHLVKKHIDSPLKCPRCEQHFIRGYDLHYHLRDEHGVVETWIAERGPAQLEGPLRDLQCSVCLKVLASKGNYERHIDYHNSLRCNYCFDYFSALRFLEGHLEHSCRKKRLLGPTEPHPRKLKCPSCYKAFHLQVKLDCHLRTQHGQRVRRDPKASRRDHVCDYCFRVFENEDALASHKIYHRTVGYFGCIYCDRKFNTLTLYRKHKNHHFSQLNVDNPTKCEHCDQTFVAFREMIYHMRDEHGDDKEWVIHPKESIEETCPICNKTFFNLHRHLQYHEQNRCSKCKEYFYSRLDFDNHLCAIESDAEPEGEDAASSASAAYSECAFCFKPITKTSSKLKHDLIHRGSGSISCRFCNLRFKTLDAFNIHAFSHRSRKYNKKPIKCRRCAETFVKYGPFVKHMKDVHKSKQKMHYRAVVKPERCVVCGGEFPNLHNHYRAHLANQCALCGKYFASARLTARHQCHLPDGEPHKVFHCDENLSALIDAYVPKDLRDDEKYYGASDDEEEGEEAGEGQKGDGRRGGEPPSADAEVNVILDEDSQNSQLSTEQEHLVPISIQSPIISDVLSLYRENPTAVLGGGGGNDDQVIDLVDDDSLDVDIVGQNTVTINIDD